MYTFIKNWIIDNGLAIMVYEPLYHDLQNSEHMRGFLGFFIFIIV